MVVENKGERGRWQWRERGVQCVGDAGSYRNQNVAAIGVDVVKRVADLKSVEDAI